MNKRIAQPETNPVTYEVIRSRLLAITDEMRIALQSVSGSPTVTDACDFFTGLFLPDGSFVSMGFQVTFQAPVVGHLIRAVYERKYFQLNDGDMFCGNDPFVGALHQNDVQLAGPIFADGKVIAWAGVEAHVTDIGGMDFASWSPRARDARQEGLRLPCVKLVEAGKMREDILEMILTATRLPAQLGLDFRAFVATLNVARERMGELVARYGAETLVAVMGEMMTDSEARFRARLSEIPDGHIHAADFLEHDGHSNELYRIDLNLSKFGDRLVFDFGGSSPQAPGFVNATRSGLEGGTIGSLLPTLAYDIPWNQGICRAKVPNSTRQCGGYPSSTILQAWGEQASREGVLQKDTVWLALGPKSGLRRMREGDVFKGRWQGGGGWGDPLDREAQAVAADLKADLISSDAAFQIYGVVCDETLVDEQATEQRRAQLRLDRVGGKFKPADASRSAKPIGSIGYNLLIVRSDDELQVISKGGCVLSRDSTRWRSGAVKGKSPLPGCLNIRLHDRLTMTSYYCPSTGQMLAVDVHEADRNPTDDVILDPHSLHSADRLAAAE
jgi:N-methylhydantoinase B/oxoprolinase/acetone carboxylase alpha subunit